MEVFLPLFSSHFYCVKIDFEERHSIVEEILKLPRKSTDPNNSNSEDSQIPIELIKPIEIKLQEIYEDIKIIKPWAHFTEPGGVTLPHTHEELDSKTHRTLSWVYWLKIPENSGDFVFYREYPKLIRKIQPKEDYLMFFAGENTHYTLKNLSNETRISISGNFVVDKIINNDIIKNILGYHNFMEQRITL